MKAGAVRGESRVPFPQEEEGQTDDDRQPAKFNLKFDFATYTSVWPSTPPQSSSKIVTAGGSWNNAVQFEDIFTSAESRDFHRQFMGVQTPPLDQRCLEVQQEHAVAVLSKKDSLYRPLMRHFRRYFRKDALSQDEYARIHGYPLA